MKKNLILTCMFSVMVFMSSCGGAGNTTIPAQTGDGAASAPSVDMNDSEAVETSENAEAGGDINSEIISGNENGDDVTEGGGSEMKEASVLLYQGHASVRISTPEGKTIYVDPYMGSGYDVPADLLLITHGHYDHTKTERIASKNEGCVTITWKEALENGEHQSFDCDYVKVEAVEAGYNANHSVTECVGYILTFSNGATLYLTGDTSTTPQMSTLAERHLDYAFFCCDGVYNMNMSEAVECALLVGAKHNIPYHMTTADNSNGFDQQTADRFDVPGSIILRPGEELILEKE